MKIENIKKALKDPAKAMVFILRTRAFYWMSDEI
jgi:hypothetical protein